MNIRIFAIGSIKERFMCQAISEYKKRLSAYSSVSINELPEIPYRESYSDAQKEHVRRQEGSRILARLRPGFHVIALDVAGLELSSEEFAEYMQGKMVSGTSDFAFVIGGSLGLAPEVLDSAHLRLSLSRMTFPHQIARFILLEQIYRAFKIMRGETYHK